MGVNYGCIVPHGFKLIEELNPEMDKKSKRIAKAIKKIANEIVKNDPEILIIASPHNLRICENIGIITTEWLKGTYTEEATKRSSDLKWKCDRSFASKLYIKAKENNLPVVAVNFGANGGEMSALWMDWGTFIPLYFIKEAYDQQKKEVPPVVLITPSREIPWRNLRELGKLINLLSEEENKKAVFIASADQGHAHNPEGPYGYDPASADFDNLVCELTKNDDLKQLFELDASFIELAKPDSLWQIFILQGIIDKTGLQNKSCVYECPDYFGMLVASFSR
ncbi:MAG: hypothetical protein ACTSQE_14260 [Candidatus Heimdallarchaeaceae archaeon]